MTIATAAVLSVFLIGTLVRLDRLERAVDLTPGRMNR